MSQEIKNLKVQLQSVAQKQRNLEIDYSNKISNLENNILLLINQVEEDKNFVKANYATWKEMENYASYRDVDRLDNKVRELLIDVNDLKLKID